MSKFLVSTCEVYRVDNEKEVEKVIEDAKEEKGFSLAKYTSEYKERKLKGEVVDQYYKLTLVKNFNDIKEPTTIVDVNYNIEQTVFPEDKGDFPEVEDETTTYEGGF